MASAAGAPDRGLQFESAAFATLGLVNADFLAIALREAGQPVQDSTPATILAFSTGRLIFGGLLLAGGLAALRGVPRIPTRTGGPRPGGLSPRQVPHRAQLMERLGIHDVAGLVRYAVAEGLVDGGS